MTSSDDNQNPYITLSMSIPATIYPTFTCKRADWEEALKNAREGKETVLWGITGGSGCRGGSLPTQTAHVTVRALPDSEEGWDRVGRNAAHCQCPNWGEVVLYESR